MSNKLLQDIRCKLFTPIDNTWLAIFRILYGSLLLIDFYHYFEKGWIQENYIDPIFHFKFYGFSWVTQLPDAGMPILFFILGVLALFITLGYLYRLSITLFAVGYTYMWLIDVTLFLEWNYFISLIAFLLIFLPANDRFSLDARLNPSHKTKTTHCWMLWLLRFQFGIVYFFAGIHKLNIDWLKGDLVSGLMAYGYTFPFIGKVQIHSEWLALILSWIGIGIDIFVVPLLIFRRTRIWGIILAILFHLHNILRFEVGIFPYLMIAGTLLFLEPKTFRILLRKILPNLKSLPESKVGLPIIRKKGFLVFLLFYCSFQIFFPLRHHLYPGQAVWTQEGYYFSWFLYARHKKSAVQFIVVDESGNSYNIKQDAIYKILTPRQYVYMAPDPNLILQFAHYLAQHLKSQGVEVKKIMVYSVSGMNMRDPQHLVKPFINLLDKKHTLTHNDWVMPLKKI